MRRHSGHAGPRQPRQVGLVSLPDGWDCLLAETPAYFGALKRMEEFGCMLGEMDDMTGLCLPNGPMHLFAYCE